MVCRIKVAGAQRWLDQGHVDCHKKKVLSYDRRRKDYCLIRYWSSSRESLKQAYTQRTISSARANCPVGMIEYRSLFRHDLYQE